MVSGALQLIYSTFVSDVAESREILQQKLLPQNFFAGEKCAVLQ